MRILITGASGQIGKSLLKRLDPKINQINLLTRGNTTNSPDKRVNYIQGDFLSFKSLKKASKNIDAIIHIAGITHSHSHELYYKVNTEGTANLLKAAKENNIKKFIFISSRTANPGGGDYANSKYLAEKEVKRSGLPYIILRLAEVYGAGEKEAVSRLVKYIKNHKYIPIIGNGEYSLMPVHISDAVGAIANAVNIKIFNREYLIAGPEEISLNNIVDRIARFYNCKIVKLHIPIIFFRLAALAASVLRVNLLTRDQIPRLLCDKPLDISVARKDLNFSPRKLEDGIKNF